MRRLPQIAFVTGVAATLMSSAASAQVYGSFAATCTRIQQRGPYVQALCEDRRGNLVPTRIDARSCRGGIANINGNLACEGSRRGYSRRDWDDDDDDYPRRRSPRGYYGSPF
jgi:hypothetical protein